MTKQEYKHELEAIILLKAGINKEFNDLQASKGTMLVSDYEKAVGELKNRFETLKAREKAVCGVCEGETISAPELFLSIIKYTELSDLVLT